MPRTCKTLQALIAVRLEPAAAPGLFELLELMRFACCIMAVFGRATGATFTLHLQQLGTCNEVTEVSLVLHSAFADRRKATLPISP